MTDRPILFSAPMIRALLDGRKTQTRRILKPQPDMTKISQPCHPEPRGNGRWVWMARDDFPEYSYATADFKVRFAKGDRLWVRERVWLPEGNDPRGHVTYHADHGDDRALKWRPGIHMPRWASRITLTVTDVRAQRLQEISEADAIAEGAPAVISGQGVDGPVKTHRTGFVGIWNKINGNWLDNPWVVAITFVVEQRNTLHKE